MSVPIPRASFQPPENIEFLDNIGISSDDFLNIVDQVGSQDYHTFGIFGL
jgi:hypothetical protein